MIALGAVGLTQRTDEASQADSEEASSDEISSEDEASSIISISDETVFDDFSEDTPPSASGTGPNGTLSPLKPQKQADPSTSDAPTQLETLPADTGRKFNPLFGAGVIYDHNIFISNTKTNRVSDVIRSLRARLALEVGDFRNFKDNFLVARWEGLGLIYTDNPEQDEFNQDAGLLGQYRWQKLLAYSVTHYLAVQLFSEFQNNDSNQTDNAFRANRADGVFVFEL